ncbi:MAG: transposase [Oscillospiraceae bacterium]|nr:transposase [Oscillospiraceae bacterium]
MKGIQERSWSRAETDASEKSAGGNILCASDGCQWKALPCEYRSGSTVHRRFQEWSAAGFFEKIWSKGLEQYDELEGIGWEWQSTVIE